MIKFLEVTEILNNSGWRYREEAEEERDGQEGEREESDEEARWGKKENANIEGRWGRSSTVDDFSETAYTSSSPMHRLLTFGITSSN